jgi:hypothetical protein
MKRIYQISEDGITEFRNIYGFLERRSFYADGKWENCGSASGMPTAEELTAHGFGVAFTLEEAKRVDKEMNK